ncbi:MAG: TM0106 family RecB-like putative nuclease [Candidatus Limnocylindrales bacterium]
MQLAKDGTVLLSATDLVGFLACDHLSTLELGRIAGRWERPHRSDDPTIALIQEKGDLHEAAYLDDLRAQGLRVVEIPKGDLRTPDDLRTAQASTLAAMRDGADVVFQATFFDGRWRGHADFLFERADRPSPGLGSWSYDIADTKLARSVKGGAILQMCVYADLLERLQGIAPEHLEVITGDRVRHPFRTADFAPYFRFVKARFEARVAAGPDGDAGTYPDPVDHCRVCTWLPSCISRRRADDHPSLVAGLSRLDTERFEQAGSTTLTAIAQRPLEAPVADMREGRRVRLREQARVQLHKLQTGSSLWELIEPDPTDPGRGLAALPEPSPWDLFFDIEADPWATEVGLEYLLGVVEAVDGEPVYHAIWATDQDQERDAFLAFLRLVTDRLDAHPEMHVYHYGGYESGAIKRLMARHGVGADEVDRLLRGDILVDLLNVVRQGIRGSVESYSLKQVEKEYMPVRQGPVTEAGFSVVAFETWLKERDQTILDGIADYNRDDCVSTYRLRAWLEDWRSHAMARWPALAWARPMPRDGAASEALSEWQAQIAALEDRLHHLAAQGTDGAQADALHLLADLLDWHRREEKSQWWRWYELKDELTVEDLVGERDAIGGLAFIDERPDGKMVVRRYRFEPQDHGFDPGDAPIDKGTGKGAGTIIALDDEQGIVTLSRSRNAAWPHPTALLPIKPIDSRVIKEALKRVADAVVEDGIDGDGPFRAARDFLLRRSPRLRSAPWGASALALPGESASDAAIRLAPALETTVLPIQGPPGTGKTWTAARMILALVRDGKTVGITAQSHKTISNLLEAVHEALDDGAHPAPRVLQRAGPLDDHAGHLPFVTLADNGQVASALEDSRVDIVAGTPWVFARPEFEGRIDVLFVDEAGQMSAANVVAMGRATHSIVLVGDPNQLPMVSQGVHPGRAGASALEHLVGDAITVPADRGLFLDVTRRLHPAINAYISDTFYDGRLTAHRSTEGQRVDALEPSLDGAGIRWIPVPHEGNGPRSREEAEVVARLVAALVGRTWTDAKGHSRPIAVGDVIVVAPYNAQVAEIQAALQRRIGRPGNVGTVDKFQGREGAVAIYSMASSSREDAPRDMGFLYSRNRLNVAVSRARALAIVVASPRLLEAGCRTPDQMHAVSALCSVVEHAGRP